MCGEDHYAMTCLNAETNDSISDLSKQSQSTAGRLIGGLLLSFHCCFICSFAFLHVTSREKSIMILVPTLGKKEFVCLLWTVMTLGHAAALFARRLRVFHSKHKTKNCLRVLGNFSLLPGFRIGRRIDLSNEMPAVLVWFVHLHDSIFIEEGLFFFGELIRLTGTERYAEGGTYQQQPERSFVHGEISSRRE